MDVLKDSAIDVPDLDECVDTFTVNAKDLELLKIIGGAETLVSIEQVVDELPNDGTGKLNATAFISPAAKKVISGTGNAHDWKTICFYITPIGNDDSEQRRHSDLFLSSLVQPALEELGLTFIRADQIGEPGMITT